MADTPVASFLAEIGFTAPDAKGARAVEDLVNRTETRITDIQARESGKRASAEAKAQGEAVQRLNRWFAQRAEAESKANDDRAKATAELFGDLLGLDKDQSAALLKHTRESSARTVQVEHDKAKKVSQIRAGQFKEASVDLLKFGAIAERVAGGLSGVLSAAPFGAFALSVERGAAGLAKLDIQAKRVGASASGIQRFLFAMKQQGVDEGEATGALEGFSSTMNSNPEGYRQALARLGVKTVDKDGKPLGRDEMLENFGSYLATQPFNIAKIQAGQFGITGDNAVRALQNPAGTRQGLQAYDTKLSSFGFDPNKAAEDARKVQQSWNNVEADFAIIRQKLDSEFFLPMMNSLDALAKKMEANPQTVENFGRALEALAIGVSARTLPVLTSLALRLTGISAAFRLFGINANPVVLGTAAVGAVLASGDPSKSLLAGGRPDTKAQDNDLGLPGLDNDPDVKSDGDRTRSNVKATGFFGWLQSKLGFGGGDDKKVAADIATTAEGVKKLADGSGLSGGMAGAGAGTGGGAGGGANLGDRLSHGAHHLGGGGWKGNYGQKGWWTDERQSYAVDYLMKNAGVSEDGAKALVARWRYVESPGGPTAVNPNSGAEGIAQWLGGRKGGGSSGSFDDQLGKVARELNGPEGRAKVLLNTPGAEARGASAFERAEGWNPRTATDNFTGRVAEGMKHIVHGGKAAAQPSSSPVGDQAALDAQKRIANGKGTPADHATIKAHREQQNTPVSKPEAWHQSPLQYTRSNGQNSLTELYKTGALKVEVTKPLPGLAETQKLIAQHLAKNPSAFSPHEMARAPILSRSGAAAVHATNVHHERHGDTFNIHGTDAKSGLDHAVKVSARREGQDRIRYGQR